MDYSWQIKLRDELNARRIRILGTYTSRGMDDALRVSRDRVFWGRFGPVIYLLNDTTPLSVGVFHWMVSSIINKRKCLH